MSYILDALRKSEQERLRACVPGLHSPPPAPLERPASRRPWQALAVLLLALNAGAFGWWLATRPGSVAAPPSMPPPPAPQAAPAAPAAPIPTDGPAERPAPVTRAVPPAPLPAPRVSIPATPADQPPPRPGFPSGADVATPPAPRRAPETPHPATSTRPSPEPDEAPAPAPPKGIVAFADLPASIRKALPPLQIGGYAEGAGGDAMLLVNDRLVSEGEDLGGGVRVLKISSDGAVFSFRNYRFRR